MNTYYLMKSRKRK